MTKRKKKKSSQNKINNLSQKILSILREHPEKTFNYKQIAAKLKVNDASGRNQIIKKLNQLAGKKDILAVDRGKFQINLQHNYYQGVVDMTSKGDAYIVLENEDNDVFVPNNQLNKALDGDLVKIYIYNKRRNRRSEGEVVEIVKRNKTKFVGTLTKQENFGFVVVNDPKMYTDIFIGKDQLDKAENGMLVLVELQEWKKKGDSPLGKIIEVLGKPGEHETEMKGILATNDIASEFPEEVERFAQQLDTSITQQEISKRRDLREVLTFTIDPKDAKDFDDALSFRTLENGNVEIGIHIADVSHYVQPNTPLDDEAYERATSIYLVDRVIPMLPEILSNKACSLRPHEEKFTFSAIFELNAQAKVINQWFGRTVTYSDARFAYEEAQHIIETKQANIPAEIAIEGESYEADSRVVEAILSLDKLAKILRKKRMQSGAISFDKVEVKFNLDEDNEPLGVFFKTAKDANKLIEEFMLLANKKVAEFIAKQEPKKTFIYRCHDEPNDEKLASLETLVAKFGYKLNLSSPKAISNSLNGLLEEVQGKKEQNLVDTLTIRSMSKAYYSTKNIGHYGLAFDAYSHFTSPIRRYPDIMAHRLLQHYLDQKPSPDDEVYEDRCNHCSDMENFATQAERDSIKYMQVKFMKNHQDETFLGVISGVTEWGIYIEVQENKCEGMVRLRDLNDDHYDYDPENFAVVGRNSKNVYQLGDDVLVKVKEADVIKRHLDFHLLGHAES
ncbi:ribonuclease R [Mesonia sp. HuA40]|uniref:ribonuclease R n=1 Tax=Mesonia sp. HuA40 TaxID=2602761 RepID=UPI0011CBE16B|nr:ribonuclease R [Mesonia sp. HuA40]TXK72588.1 ribonuclease R [Mesonia sp. HuA40]